MPTIADVAKLAGVSLSTVSHVLNRTRYVSAQKTHLVEAAIAEIGYVPNAVARSLRAASTRTVGLAISTIANPYFADIVCAIETHCAKLGLMVFLADTQDDPERELRVVQALHARQVEGIILAPSADPSSALDHAHRFGIPCVLVDRLADVRFDRVGVDNAAATEGLVRHLLDAGHRRIGFVGGHPGFATTEARAAAFRATLAAAGVQSDPDLSDARARTQDDVTAAVASLLDRKDPPTALVAGNNLVTIAALRALRRRGLMVPRDVSLVGIDDFDWADCFEPRLTLVAQPCAEIGRQAATLLIERIRDPDAPPRMVHLAAELKVRGSVGRPA